MANKKVYLVEDPYQTFCGAYKTLKGIEKALQFWRDRYIKDIKARTTDILLWGA